MEGVFIMGVPGTINPKTGNVYGGTPPSNNNSGGGGSSNVVQDPETGKWSIATKPTPPPRVQTFTSSGKKISDTGRVEVTLSSGEKKWVTPESALAQSQPGTIKYREAEKKLEAKRDSTTLKERVEPKKEESDSFKRLDTIRKSYEEKKEPPKRDFISMSQDPYQQGTGVSQKKEPSKFVSMATDPYQQGVDISDKIRQPKPKPSFLQPTKDLLGSLKGTGKDVGTSLMTPILISKEGTSDVGFTIKDRELQVVTGTKTMDVSSAKQGRGTKEVWFQGETYKVSPQRTIDIKTGFSLFDAKLIPETVGAYSLYTPAGGAVMKLPSIIGTGAKIIAAEAGFGVVGQTATVIVTKSLTGYAIGEVGKKVVDYKVQDYDTERKQNLYEGIDIASGLYSSGVITVETAGLVGNIPAIANLATKGGFLKYSGVALQSLTGTVTAYGAVGLQQDRLESSLVGEEEKRYISTEYGRTQAEPLIGAGRKGKAAEGIGWIESYEQGGIGGVGKKAGKGIVYGLFPSFKSDKGFLEAAEQKAIELGIPKPGKAARAALALERVEEVKFTQKVIIPEIGANVFGGGLDIVFPKGGAILTRGGPGVLESSLATRALLERTPYSETTIAGQTITFEDKPFFIKLPKKGAKEEYQLAEESYITKVKEYETLIGQYPTKEGIYQVPEEQFGMFEQRKTDIESSLKSFTESQKKYGEQGKLRIGSLAIYPTAAVLGGASASLFKGFEKLVQKGLPKAGPVVTTGVGYAIDVPEEIIGDIFTPGGTANVVTFTGTLSSIGDGSKKGTKLTLPTFSQIESSISQVSKTKTKTTSPVAPFTDVSPISPLALISPVSPIAQIAPISEVPSFTDVAPFSEVAPFTDVAPISQVAPITNALVFTPKLPLFPFPLGLDFLGGEGGYTRKKRKRKTFRYTPDFIALVLDEYGPAPSRRTFTGQERRYKIRGQGFISPLVNVDNGGIFGLIRNRLKI